VEVQSLHVLIYTLARPIYRIPHPAMVLDKPWQSIAFDSAIAIVNGKTRSREMPTVVWRGK